MARPVDGLLQLITGLNLYFIHHLVVTIPLLQANCDVEDNKLMMDFYLIAYICCYLWYTLLALNQTGESLI
jgi:glycopeptide antibiotics resistance protein